MEENDNNLSFATQFNRLMDDLCNPPVDRAKLINACVECLRSLPMYFHGEPSELCRGIE